MKDKSAAGAGRGISRFAGSLAALFTIIIWGTTFISTKVLLADFQPVEILFLRFVLGFLALFAVCPRRLKGVSRRQEMIFALAGLCGTCLYFLLENIALTLTMASNVGVIISVAPIFTALLSRVPLSGFSRVFRGISREEDWRERAHRQERLGAGFFCGFLVAMAGIAMISFNGAKLSLNPAGDFLAVLAAFVWACYSLLTREIGKFGYPVILTTRRTFFYGLAFMVPALCFFDFSPDFRRFAEGTNLFNILYLGLGASALCFVTWNVAVKTLGAVKTSVYIYMVPVITVVTSSVILHERVTPVSAAGTALAVAGLFLSEYEGKNKEDKENGFTE